MTARPLISHDQVPVRSLWFPEPCPLPGIDAFYLKVLLVGPLRTAEDTYADPVLRIMVWVLGTPPAGIEPWALVRFHGLAIGPGPSFTATTVELVDPTGIDPTTIEVRP